MRPKIPLAAIAKLVDEKNPASLLYSTDASSAGI